LNTLKHCARALWLASLTLAAGTALAHGDENHDKPKSEAIKKEQKPWGIAGDPKAVQRTVEHKMLDSMRFTPNHVEVEAGDTVKFVIKNDGKVMHEFVLGTKKELDEHAELMKKFPNMEHDEPYMAHVKPGKTGEIVWTFNRPGEFEFACLIAGHYQAGMVGKVSVVDRNQARRDAVPAKLVAQVEGAMTDGEVRKVDKESRKITLKHGELKNLGMPGMTMVFQVKDPALLDKLKAGDKVRFNAEKSDSGFVVTAIEPVK
jgi:uncharacterized cupredoxin-like copper-binding protein